MRNKSNKRHSKNTRQAALCLFLIYSQAISGWAYTDYQISSQGSSAWTPPAKASETTSDAPALGSTGTMNGQTYTVVSQQACQAAAFCVGSGGVYYQFQATATPSIAVGDGHGHITAEPTNTGHPGDVWTVLPNTGQLIDLGQNPSGLIESGPAYMAAQVTGIQYYNDCVANSCSQQVASADLQSAAAWLDPSLFLTPGASEVSINPLGGVGFTNNGTSITPIPVPQSGSFTFTSTASPLPPSAFPNMPAGTAGIFNWFAPSGAPGLAANLVASGLPPGGTLTPDPSNPYLFYWTPPIPPTGANSPATGSTISMP